MKKLLIALMLIVAFTGISYAQITFTDDVPTLDRFKNNTDYTLKEKFICLGEDYIDDDGYYICKGDYKIEEVIDYGGSLGTLNPKEEMTLYRQAIFELNERVKYLEEHCILK